MIKLRVEGHQTQSPNRQTRIEAKHISRVAKMLVQKEKDLVTGKANISLFMATKLNFQK